MSRFVLLLGILIAGLVAAAPASAAPVRYALQIGSTTNNRQLTLDGDQITGFRAWVLPQTCGQGDPRNSSDSRWVVTLPGDNAVPIADGRFQFSGQAPGEFYDGSSADFTVTGEVSPDHRVVTGAITISNGQDPFLKGCSGSYSYLAIPYHAASGRGPAAKRDFTSQFLNFNYRGGIVTRLRLAANFECGGGVDSAEFDSEIYGYRAIRASASGSWAIHLYVFDGYDNIVHLDVTGHIKGRKATGRIKVTEPPGLTGISGEPCSGDYRWTAMRPRPPAPPGPTAFFRWNAVRVPAGAEYRYYFYITGLTCRNRANAVRLTVAGRRLLVRCAKHQGWASGPVAPGRRYPATAQAVRTRRGRVVRRGTKVSETLQMPGPNDHWAPIHHLPGDPPD